MNIKTTIVLALAVILVSVAYLGWHSVKSAKTAEVAEQGGPQIGAAGSQEKDDQQRMLAQPPFEQDTKIVKVVHHRRGKEPMVFELMEDDAQSTQGNWMMAQPTRCRATNWMVNNIILAVKRLKYATKFTVGEADGISLEQAGLLPEPVATFEITADQGDTVEVQVGDLLVGDRNAYVYLPSRANEIFVAEEDFGNILEREVTQFRERNMIQFAVSDAVELEITERKEGETRHFQLLKKDGKWRFTAPFKAKAETKKIQEVVSNLNRLWARSWLEEIPANLTEFGLGEPYLGFKVVTEKTITLEEPAEEEEEEVTTQPVEPEDSKPETRIQRKEYALFLSDRKPIDDDTLVYAKRAEDEQVGMINAAELDKFIPRINEWRDMDIIEANITEADSISVVLEDETIELARRNNKWFFAGTENPAEPEVVDSLLKALDDLSAVNFVDHVEGQSFGMESSRATITLTFPDSSDVETIKVGDYTETVEKRLRYVQRVGTVAVAKVRSRDLNEIFRDSLTYRNREILDYAESRLLKIELSRQLPAKGGLQSLTLQRDENNMWQMTTPITADVNLKPVNELVSKLAKLRGIGVVDEPDPHKLGLDLPDIEATITIEGVPTVKLPDENDAEEETTIYPEPITRRLLFAKHDDHVYAKRLDLTTFFEVDSKTYQALMAEFLDSEFWSFEPSQVVAFSSTQEQHTVSFSKDKDRWHYSADPDIPIDSEKVNKHISQMRNLKTRRYVDYHASDLKAYGLDVPAHRFVFEFEDGTVTELLVSKRPYDGDGSKRFFATVAGSNRVFLVRPRAVELGVIKLDRFEPDE